MDPNRRLQKAFFDAPTLPLSRHARYVLFSDCHRGRGNSNDNFLKNQHLYSAALQYYHRHGYTYIELGDGDELWENRSMGQIMDIHRDTFDLLARFYREKRLYLLYGNHDIIKMSSAKARQSFTPLFPRITFHSGLILKDMEHKKDIYLTHGHQTDLFNSTLWPVNRFLVRYLWGPLERRGFLDPTSAAKNNKKKRRTEEKLTEWAKENGCILITGHTHRPMIGTADAPYCNTGSCVHPYGITCIEIHHRCLTLVKWMVETKPDQILYVSREKLADTICIDDLKTSV